MEHLLKGTKKNLQRLWKNFSYEIDTPGQNSRLSDTSEESTMSKAVFLLQ